MRIKKKNLTWINILAKTKGKFCSLTERREQQRYSSIQVFFVESSIYNQIKGGCIQNMKKTKKIPDLETSQK